MKTECSKCGCQSEVMGRGNICHNDNCGGVHMPICKQCSHQLRNGRDYQGYCYQCAVDKGIEKNIFGG